MRMFILVLAFMSLTGEAVAQSPRPYTLYRNSITIGNIRGGAQRIHIASFDTKEGEPYNKENCETAAGLFQRQPGVKVRYWCELGAYRP
ncbi:hypothetical protein ASC80_05655 [Afipia sp. Root123D2]|nr:hypothetical protein ASC80_05655 [Afipia sp. Root123D2]